jgi:2-amino-4-hydroxy-6-hydroxymethyldihydropteridine diphosphokinase
MIIIGLGSNINGPWGDPAASVGRALDLLDSEGCRLVRASSLVQSAPLGRIDQPNFVNAVAQIETALAPKELLDHLHAIEIMAGRRRGEKWGPRVLDLDIIDYEGLIRGQPPPILPHPGITERAFVLAPIAEIAPEWRHPILKISASELLDRLRGKSEGAVLKPGADVR